jgi:predicted deacylase
MSARKEVHFLARHRAHDYRGVVEAWRVLASDAGAEIGVFAADGGYPVIWVAKEGDPSERGLYLSAGIHGDEPASVWGLIEWARLRLARQKRPLVIFPCLNPWGLVNNSREDRRGRDLNRTFTSPMPALVRRWERVLARYTPEGWFHTAVCLHEDYDARGNYCYELYRRGRPAFAREAMDAASVHIPNDPRHVIEGRAAEDGLIRRAALPKMDGWPEAFSLYTHWAWQVLTFETPSEFSLYRRVLAQAAFVRAVESAMDA